MCIFNSDAWRGLSTQQLTKPACLIVMQTVLSADPNPKLTPLPQPHLLLLLLQCHNSLCASPESTENEVKARTVVTLLMRPESLNLTRLYLKKPARIVFGNLASRALGLTADLYPPRWKTTNLSVTSTDIFAVFNFKLNFAGSKPLCEVLKRDSSSKIEISPF